jgi:4'-phosphopantetheinyl transferase
MDRVSDMAEPVFHASLDERIGERRGVHVWMRDLDAKEDDWLDRSTLLSDDEWSRLGRLRSPVIQRRLARSHAIARHLLAGILDKPAREIAFVRNAFGKPFVQLSAATASSAAPDFNFSHSENAFLFGVHFGGAVGVDVEVIRDSPDWLAVAALLFSPAEMASLDASSSSERQHLFFRYWTTREATGKLTGRGWSASSNDTETGIAGDCRHFQTTFGIGSDCAAATVVWSI